MRAHIIHEPAEDGTGRGSWRAWRAPGLTPVSHGPRQARPMRNIDFSSWQALLSTLGGLAIITLLGVGIRLLAQQTVQQRRERENRQINERLRTLIAAYKTLGGSFTGNLTVDPTHLRELRSKTSGADDSSAQPATDPIEFSSSDRSRRIRDAVEAALS